MGRVEAALEACAQGHAAHLALTGPPLPWRPEAGSLAACEVLLHAGRFEEARRIGMAAYRQTLTDGSTEIQAHSAWQLGRLFLAGGQVATAARYGREAAVLLRDLGRIPILAYTLATLVNALAVGGRVDEAAATLAELDGISMPPKHMWAVDALQARAWTAVAADDLPAARHFLEAAVDLGEETGDRVGQLAALHDLARLGHGKEVVCELSGVAAEMEGGLASLRATHAQALVSSDGAALEQVSAGFEAIGSDLLAAEAAADAAVAWRKQGDPRKSAAAERRAHLLAARCEGARTPALMAVSARAALTARELEIARLAAAGVANKEIAARLYLSLHTVQNKLHSAYEKLGVEGRAELAQALEGY
jgi:DNA-binding CsgD family transcriptional regulator